MNSSWRFGLPGNEKINLQKNQFVLYYPGKKGESITFEKDKEYQSFEVFCEPKKLTEILKVCPYITNLMKNKECNEPFIQHKPLWTPHQVVEMVHQLPGNKVSNDLRPLFNFLLNQMNVTLDEQLPLKEEIVAVLKAKEMILKDITAHYTIDKIANKVGLNEYRLKYVFKRVFETSIYQCLLNERMRQAKYLLETTNLSMQQIANRTGYQFLTSFITAFHKFYNFTPRLVKRNVQTMSVKAAKPPIGVVSIPSPALG